MDMVTHTKVNHKGTRNCEHCGAVYTPKVKWQLYCNNDGKCRMAAFRKRHPPTQPEVLEELKKLREENKEIKEKLGMK